MKYKRLRELKLPYDVKKLPQEDLSLLAVELREELIDAVSKNGGHLASNLGIVELTIALQRVFDTSKDRIIWDVGHQAYIHKMLTGRLGDFSSLRKIDGLSGFPKKSESIHDAFDTGHSSNSISLAHGMAFARDKAKDDYHVIAVIGDGSLTGGPAYEGLNNLGASNKEVTIILNDNGMSIGTSTGGISEHLSKLRVSKGYYKFKSGLRSSMRRVPVVGDSLYQGASKLRDVAKYALVDGVFFEELGFTYIGPVDGHDIDALIQAVETAKSAKGPSLLHIITTKGKGYPNAESDPDIYHGTGPFDPTTGVSKKKKETTFSDIFGLKMIEYAEKNKGVFCISAAMIDGVGLDYFSKVYPEKIIDVGIAEQHAVSMAAGMATCGARPIVSIYSTFLQRAYDQLMMDICLADLPVIFAIDRAGIVGADGETHQGIFDIAYLSNMPNMIVLAPSSAYSMSEMFDFALRQKHPVAIRYPRGHCEKEIMGEPPFDGQARIINDGHDVVLFSAGNMLSNVISAREILKDEGIDAAVIDAGIIKPLDERVLNECIRKTKTIVTIEDGIIKGGMASAVALHIARSGADCRHIAIGWPQRFIEHGSQEELMARYGLDAQSIAARIKSELK